MTSRDSFSYLFFLLYGRRGEKGEGRGKISRTRLVFRPARPALFLTRKERKEGSGEKTPSRLLRQELSILELLMRREKGRRGGGREEKK